VESHKAYEKAGLLASARPTGSSSMFFMHAHDLQHLATFSCVPCCKAIFPERSEDWFRTMFLFKSTIEFKGGSVMYSLRKIKSQAVTFELVPRSSLRSHAAEF